MNSVFMRGRRSGKSGVLCRSTLSLRLHLHIRTHKSRKVNHPGKLGNKTTAALYFPLQKLYGKESVHFETRTFSEGKPQ